MLRRQCLLGYNYAEETVFAGLHTPDINCVLRLVTMEQTNIVSANGSGLTASF